MLFYVFLGERTEQIRCIVDGFFLIFKKKKNNQGWCHINITNFPRVGPIKVVLS